MWIKSLKFYIRYERKTVKMGDELFIVSTKEIVATLSAIKPNTIENNLKNK